LQAGDTILNESSIIDLSRSIMEKAVDELCTVPNTP